MKKPDGEAVLFTSSLVLGTIAIIIVCKRMKESKDKNYLKQKKSTASSNTASMGLRG